MSSAKTAVYLKASLITHTINQKCDLFIATVIDKYHNSETFETHHTH